MKKNVFIFLLLTQIVLAQDNLSAIKYLDSLGHPATKETFFRYQTFQKENPEEEKYVLQTFNKQDHIFTSYTYSDVEGKKLNGESITYYDNGNKESTTNYLDNSPTGKAFSWYKNGNLKEEGVYIDASWDTERHFKIINCWDEKGKQTVINGNGYAENKNDFYIEEGNYKEGFKEGKWSGHSIQNIYSYEENYVDGKLISGISTEFDGTKNEYSSLEVKPEPKKGLKDFYKFISNHFTATNLAYKNKVKGKILLEFVVDKTGKITDIKVIKGLGYGLDEEAIRVLSIYEDWYPALQKGRRVKCRYTIPISLDFSY